MRRRLLRVALVVTGLLGSLAWGALAWYTAESQVGWLTGYAQWQSEEVDPLSGSVEGRSRLYCPASQPLVGARFTTPALWGWLARVDTWTKLGARSGVSRMDNWDLTSGEPVLYLEGDARSELSRVFIGEVSLVSPSRLVGPLQVSAVAGWRREKFTFSGFDGTEVGYGPLTGLTRTFEGLCMRYSATYDLPYLGLTAPVRIGRLDGRVELGFSPLMLVRDRFEGAVVTDGRSTGTAVLTRAEVVYPLKNGLELSGHLSYGLRTGDGTEQQHRVEANGSLTYRGEFDQEVRSEQFLAGLTLRQRY